MSSLRFLLQAGLSNAPESQQKNKKNQKKTNKKNTHTLTHIN